VTYEAYAVSRTSTRPQVDSARTRHRDQALPPAPAGPAHLDQPGRVHLRWTRGLEHPGKLDGTPAVALFGRTREDVCMHTIEQGDMTKDLALLVGRGTPFLTTEEFLAKLADNLRMAMNL